ncbi:hypothetical protein WDU94_001689 [Cyamophila willieti]
MEYSRHCVLLVVLLFGPITIFSECDRASDNTKDSATTLETDQNCFNSNMNQYEDKDTSDLPNENFGTCFIDENQKITDYEKFWELVSPKKQPMCEAQQPKYGTKGVKISKIDFNFSVSNSSMDKLSYC